MSRNRPFAQPQSILAACLILWITCTELAGQVAAHEPALERYRLVLGQIDQGDAANVVAARQAIAKLNELPPSPYHQLIAIYGEYHKGGSQLAKASLTVLLSKVPSSDHVTRLSCADMARRTQNYDLAAQLYGQIGKASTDIPRVEAEYGFAWLELSQYRPEKALEWLRKAEVSVRIVDKSGVEQDLRNRIAQTKALTERAIRFLKYGVGYNLYSNARKLQLEGRWNDAIAAYTELLRIAHKNANNNPELLLKMFREKSGPVFDLQLLMDLPIEVFFVDASRFHMLSCLRASGGKDIRGDLENFIRANPAGPMRGEALLLRSDLYIDEGDIRGALALVEECLKWIEGADSGPAVAEKFGVRPAVVSDFPPPKQWRTRDSLGNPIWVTPTAQTIVFRGTAPWYLDWLRYRSHQMRAALLFASGQPQEGLPNITAMLHLDPIDQAMAGNGLSNFGRLRDGFASGRLYATKAELALFPPKVLPRVVLAEMAFECEHWSDAVQGYTTLIASAGSSLSKEALLYLRYALASCLLYQNQVPKAKAILLEHFSGTSPLSGKAKITHMRAMMALSNAFQREDPFPWLHKALEAAPDAESRVDVQFLIGQHYFVRKDRPEHAAQARTIFTTLMSQIPQSHYKHKACSQYIALLGAQP